MNQNNLSQSIDEVMSFQRKANRNIRSVKYRKALIKKANELRGYKEPREPLNIRIRGLINQSESSENKIQNSSLHFIWNRYGIGFNKLQ